MYLINWLYLGRERPQARPLFSVLSADCRPRSSIIYSIYIYYTMGPGPGLVARVLWLYWMRLASSGVGGVRRVRLANTR